MEKAKKLLQGAMSYTPALTPPSGAASAVMGSLADGAKQGAGLVRRSACLDDFLHSRINRIKFLKLTRERP